MKSCYANFPSILSCRDQKEKSNQPTSKAKLRTPSMPAKVVARRPTFHQGRALEVVGHAIEYLVDSGIHEHQAAVNTEAIWILMRASQSIFAECREAVSISQSLKGRAIDAAHWLNKASRKLKHV